jgi:hypothetical protein
LFDDGDDGGPVAGAAAGASTLHDRREGLLLRVSRGAFCGPYARSARPDGSGVGLGVENATCGQHSRFRASSSAATRSGSGRTRSASAR